MQTMDHAADTPAGLADVEATATRSSRRAHLLRGRPTSPTSAFRIDGPDGSPGDRLRARARQGAAPHRRLPGPRRVTSTSTPCRDADGTWSVEIDLSVPGTYRALADFTPERRRRPDPRRRPPGRRGPSSPAPTSTTVQRRRGGRLQGHPRRRARAGDESSALTLVDREGRSPGHRPGALPGGLRPPRRPARRATSPTSTSTPRAHPATARRRRPRGRLRRPASPRPGPTGSSSTSSTTAWCAPPRSPSRCPRTSDRPGRPRDGGPRRRRQHGVMTHHRHRHRTGSSSPSAA